MTDPKFANIESSDVQNSNYTLPERTDYGNAQMLAGLYQGKMYYSPAHGWLVWERKRWRQKTDHQMWGFAKRAAKRREKLADLSDDRKEEIKWSFQSRSKTRLRDAIELAKGLDEFQCDDITWDANPYLFGAANGVLNLQTAELQEERAEDFILHHSPVEFDPDATCPRFEQFLKEIFGDDPELISYVQRAIGYSLTGDVSEQCFFCCYGSGANGKSTLLNVLTHVFGEYSVNLPFNAFELSKHGASLHDLVELPGRRFATSSESRDGSTFNEQRLKMLTGGDPITVRHLYQEQFTFYASHKLWLGFNSRPNVQDSSPAMWRRVRLIPFPKQFSGEADDKDLSEKLKAELPGILNWAVVGCALWQRDGLKPPQTVTKATEQYRADADEIGQFVEANFEPASSEIVPVAEVWTAYGIWCLREGIKPLGRITFNDKLEQRGFERRRHGKAGIWYWHGFKIRHPNMAEKSQFENPGSESDLGCQTLTTRNLN